MNNQMMMARLQGLNWQALLVEEAQTEIKILIKNEVLKLTSFNSIMKKVNVIIDGVVEELEIDTLREATSKGLTAFATRLYVYYSQTFQNRTLVQIMAFIAIINGVATTQQIQIADKTLKDIVPSAYERRVPLDVFAKDYMKTVNERLDYLAGIQAKEDYTTRLSLRNIAEMQVRQEEHKKALEKFQDKGVNLVWIVPHANASKRCEPWQGKLYSLNGTYGEIDGQRYQPLENATDQYETTKSGKIYKNGIISGFNCRHKIIAYSKGNKPIKIPASVVEKEREINDKQRYLERGVRLWKERALLYKGLDNKKYIYSRDKAKLWNARYIDYSISNKVAYYNSRTDIL
jgi:hypothetical protein